MDLKKGEFWKKISQKLSYQPSPKKTKSYSLIKLSNPLNIDINSNTCCILKTGGALKNISISKLDVVTTPDNSISECKITDSTPIETALANLLRKNQIKKDSSAISIPGSMTINKQVNVKKNMTDKQIQNKVDIEAQHAFPESEDDLYIDYSLSEKNDNYQTLNIIAIHKADLDPYLHILKKSHLKPKVVDVDYYTLDRIYPYIRQSLPETKQDSCNAVFLLTSDYFLLTVHKKNEFIYTHRQPFQGKAFIKIIQNIINEEETSITPQDFETIGKNISHLLQFYFSTFNDSYIETIILTGPLAIIPRLAAQIQQYTTIDTVIGNPIKTLMNKSNYSDEKIDKLGPLFTLCMSLALRGVKNG